MRLFSLGMAAALALGGAALAQQVADPDVDLSVAGPAYAANQGPRVAIDAGHGNYHTVDGRYAPFARLLRNDGYRVAGREGPLTAASLRDVDVLVIANAQGEADPANRFISAPAITVEEAATLRRWVEGGGALLLIADHAPFPSAIAPLSAAFGVDWANVYALQPGAGGADVFTPDSGLADSPVRRGEGGGEPVGRVRTFTGSAFTPPAGAIPLLVLGPGWRLVEPGPGGPTPASAATSPDGAGRVQGALLQVGRGRVAFMGEAAMFSAQLQGPERRPMGMNAPGAEENKTFLRNVFRWLRPPR